jgi:hypothetical protein
VAICLTPTRLTDRDNTVIHKLNVVDPSRHSIVMLAEAGALAQKFWAVFVGSSGAGFVKEPSVIHHQRLFRALLSWWESRWPKGDPTDVLLALKDASSK